MNLPRARLVSRDVWKPYLENTLAKAAPETAHAARVLLHALHDRHVGITPRLALELAPLAFETRTSRAAKGPWAVVRDRLLAVLGARGRDKARFGLLLGASPAYAIQRIVLPVVAEACRDEDENLLFCDDPLENSPTPTEYLDYEKRLHTRVARIVGADETLKAHFWRDRAITLSQISRPGRGLTEQPQTLAESDQTGSDLIWNLEPELPTKRVKRANRVRATHRAARQHTRRREGGIDGIIFSRRLEEVGGALFSERVHHPLVQADRLLNSGFLIHRRHPKQREPRGVHIAGMLPPGSSSAQLTSFLKACWCDFAARFTHLLLARGLTSSRFHWIEGDSLGRARRLAFSIQPMAGIAKYLHAEPDIRFRRQWIEALGVLPALLEPTGYEILPAHDQPTSSPDDLQWPRSAWRRWYGPGAFDSRQNVHIMMFLPIKDRINEDQETPRLVQGGPGSRVTVTWVPEDLSRPDWWYSSSLRPPRSLFPGIEASPSLERMAGRLIHTWTEELEREAWRD